MVLREQRKQPLGEEKVLEAAGPEFIAMAAVLRDSRAVRAIRRLHKLYVDYPADTVRACLARALEHGLADLNRIERMILRRLGQDFFRLPTHREDDDG